MALPSYVGRYAVRHEIGRGGFAIVVLAWDEELDSAVALKILEGRQGRDPRAEARFLDEARMLRRVRSHHVVTVHDVGRLNDGRPYFVMDFADCGTLADWMERQRAERPTDPPAATPAGLMALTDAIADGLDAIHRAGLVHRDVKPANILFQSGRPVTRSAGEAAPVAADPEMTVIGPAAEAPPPVDLANLRILVGDLGIAATADSGQVAAGGTPAYQAPEQTERGRPPTPAADIYAATAVLYHLVVGSRPPRPGELEAVIVRVPEPWREVMRRGLDVDPQRRFATIHGWRAAVQDVLSTLAADAAETTTVLLGGPSDPAVADCPYKGLGSYQPDDAGRFFGREALTEELVRRLQIDNVLVVGGPSGSGKSSLVRAGLVPALRSGHAPGSEGWRIALMSPGRDAMAELYFQIVQATGAGTGPVGLDGIAARPSLARRLAHPAGTEPPLVLVVDQFEELFTLNPPAQRDAFLEALSAMADPADSRVKVVLAVRADFYANCAQDPWLAERISGNQVLVGPMSAPELRRAITEPARHSGLYLERSLVDTIVEDAAGEAGSLPLVAHALVETWLRRKGATMTLEGYRASGGVAGAIAQSAEAIYGQRLRPAEQAVARRLFLRLVTPGEGAGDTRRIVGRDEIANDPEPRLADRVVDLLTGARLLTVDDRTVQISHEALLRSWPRLRGWIDEARDDLRTRQRLIRHGEEWLAADRDTDLLLRGTALLAALDWQAKNPDQASGPVRDFLDASVDERERAETADRQRRARTRRVRTAAVAALSLLAAGATAASVVAYMAFRDARQNELSAAAARLEADNRFALALGAVADGLARDDPRLSLFLAGEAAARAGDGAPGHDARSAMIAARLQLAGPAPHLLGSPIQAGDAKSLAMSPDGSYLAIGRRDGTIGIVDTHARQPVGPPLTGHRGGIEDLAFSSDGSLLVSAGSDRTARVWPIGDGFAGEGRIAATIDDTVWGIAIDPTGRWLATAGEDQTVRVWDIASGEQSGPPLAEWIGDALSVGFAPDGGVVAGTGSGSIHGWRMPERTALFEPIRHIHTSDVWGILFSIDGSRFATLSSDRTVQQFRYPDGEHLGGAFDPADHIHSAIHLPVGSILVGGDDQGRIHIWDTEAGAPVSVSAPGHTGRVAGLAASADGRLLASLGTDQTVRLWTLFDDIMPAREMSVGAGAAKGVAISADGSLVAAGDDAGTVLVWRGGRDEPLRLRGHDHQVWAVAPSPDGGRLVSADRSGEVRAWALDDGATAWRSAGRDGAIWWIGFTPDGTRVVAAADGGITILDAGSGERLAGLPQDGGQATRAALSPDGSTLAVSATDGRVRLFDPAAGTLLGELDVFEDVAWTVSFSPDGRYLAAGGSDEVVSIWDVAERRRVAEFAGHSGGATDVGFLHGGATVVAVDRRGGLHVWDLVAQRRLAPPVPGHARASWRLATAPDADRFVTAGDDGAVRDWDILSIRRACEIGSPAFDRERLQEFFGDGSGPLACGGPAGRADH